jgi:hypothetical protein
MLDKHQIDFTPRARAVSDPALDTLQAGADELARRWAIALILARPLAEIGEVPLEELAREASALCSQTVMAIQSDGALERLTGQGARSAGESAAPAQGLAAMVGAGDAAAAVGAVEALRGVLWDALLEEMRPSVVDRSNSRHVAELSDRLAYVCARLLSVAVARVGQESRPPAAEEPIVVTMAERTYETPIEQTPAAVRAVIIDEHATGPAAEIEIRDQRREEGAAAWVGSIGRQLARFSQDRLPFAVLLVEILEIERLRREESPDELARLAELVEDVLAAELRPVAGGAARGREPGDPGRAPWSGWVTRQRPGRYWLLMPEMDRLGARKMSERLVRAVGDAIEYRGASLAVVAGVAVCPEDGTEAPALAAQADVGLYAARSSAVRAAASIDEPT